MCKDLAAIRAEVVSLRASVNEQANAITQMGKLVSEMRDLFKPLHDVISGGGIVAKFIINTAKVFAAISIIAGSLTGVWYAMSHWRPH